MIRVLHIMHIIHIIHVMHVIHVMHEIHDYTVYTAVQLPQYHVTYWQMVFENFILKLSFQYRCQVAPTMMVVHNVQKIHILNVYIHLQLL